MAEEIKETTEAQNEEKKKKKKEKKKKLALGRTISNNMFALKEIWKGSPLYIAVYLGSSFIYGTFDFLTEGYLLRRIVNGIEAGESVTALLRYVFTLAIIILSVYTALSWFWNVTSPIQSRKIGAHIEKMLFRKAAKVELACYEDPAFYDKYVKAMDEAYDRILKVMYTLDNLIARVIALSANSILLFIIDPWLILFGLFPLVLGVFRRLENIAKHDHKTAQKPINRRAKYVRRTFYLGEYAKEMRIGEMYRRMLDELKDIYTDFKAITLKYGLKRALARFISNVGLEVVTILGAMLYAVWKTVLVGDMTIGDCIVILNSIGTISYCLNNMVQNLAEFGEHSLFIDDVRYFLDYEPKMKEDENAPAAHGGDIVFENVSFKYEGAEKETLHNISIEIKQGEKIALVGHNGSGKTTLVKLLLRLYDPCEGVVKLDGMDVRDYRLSSYRDNYSCVFQDFKVFSLSVVKNVLLRRTTDEDNENVINALKESGAYDKIEKLEKEIETTLTREFDENGANLSVGEQQKVSLARVFAQSSPCIVLDEPSSALDPIAEHKMFENMMRAAKDRSVVFISHRLSSAVDADRIYLMENGSIVEVGSHKELMEKEGKYAEMFHLQAKNYVGGGDK